METLIQVVNLKKYFPVRSGLFKREKGFVHAVDSITFDIRQGETLGLVGESGCGKTTVAKLLLKLLEPTEGEVYFRGRNIFDFKGEDNKRLRRNVQMVFQDPFASLNPRKKVRQILTRPFKLHNTITKEEIEKRIFELLESVGLIPAQLYVDRYPHEFSGGQRQRIGIARAIAVRPSLVVADEPVASLDMSTRAQVLNLMKKLQKELRLSYLFITHDLAVVRSLCNRVAVMYVGELVEMSDVAELYSNPLHPYTQALLSATPIPDPELANKREHLILKGDVPSPINPPSGCRFHTRCPNAKTVCSDEIPHLEKHSDGHFVACLSA